MLNCVIDCYQGDAYCTGDHGGSGPDTRKYARPDSTAGRWGVVPRNRTRNMHETIYFFWDAHNKDSNFFP